MGKAKKSSGKKKVSDIIIGAIVIAIVVAFCGYMIKIFAGFVNDDGNDTTKETAAVTELDKLMNRNLDARYPETPAQVAELYCSITKELHSKDITEEQITKLHRQLRKLFDEELLANNDYEKHLEKLSKEVKQYQNRKMTISRYVVQDNDDITIYTDEEGKDCTKVAIAYSIKKDSEWLKSNEQLILRKDGDGCWRILGNEEAKAVESEENEE